MGASTSKSYVAEAFPGVDARTRANTRANALGAKDPAAFLRNARLVAALDEADSLGVETRVLRAELARLYPLTSDLVVAGDAFLAEGGGERGQGAERVGGAGTGGAPSTTTTTTSSNNNNNATPSKAQLAKLRTLAVAVAEQVAAARAQHQLVLLQQEQEQQEQQRLVPSQADGTQHHDAHGRDSIFVALSRATGAPPIPDMIPSSASSLQGNDGADSSSTGDQLDDALGRLSIPNGDGCSGSEGDLVHDDYDFFGSNSFASTATTCTSSLWTANCVVDCGSHHLDRRRDDDMVAAPQRLAVAPAIATVVSTTPIAPSATGTGDQLLSTMTGETSSPSTATASGTGSATRASLERVSSDHNNAGDDSDIARRDIDAEEPDASDDDTSSLQQRDLCDDMDAAVLALAGLSVSRSGSQIASGVGHHIHHTHHNHKQPASLASVSTLSPEDQDQLLQNGQAPISVPAAPGALALPVASAPPAANRRPARGHRGKTVSFDHNVVVHLVPGTGPDGDRLWDDYFRDTCPLPKEIILPHRLDKGSAAFASIPEVALRQCVAATTNSSVSAASAAQAKAEKHEFDSTKVCTALGSISASSKSATFKPPSRARAAARALARPAARLVRTLSTPAILSNTATAAKAANTATTAIATTTATDMAAADTPVATADPVDAATAAATTVTAVTDATTASTRGLDSRLPQPPTPPPSPPRRSRRSARSVLAEQAYQNGSSEELVSETSASTASSITWCSSPPLVDLLLLDRRDRQISLDSEFEGLPTLHSPKVQRSAFTYPEYGNPVPSFEAGSSEATPATSPLRRARCATSPARPDSPFAPKEAFDFGPSELEGFMMRTGSDWKSSHPPAAIQGEVHVKCRVPFSQAAADVPVLHDHSPTMTELITSPISSMSSLSGQPRDPTRTSSNAIASPASFSSPSSQSPSRTTVALVHCGEDLRGHLSRKLANTTVLRDEATLQTKTQPRSKLACPSTLPRTRNSSIDLVSGDKIADAVRLRSANSATETSSGRVLGATGPHPRRALNAKQLLVKHESFYRRASIDHLHASTPLRSTVLPVPAPAWPDVDKGGMPDPDVSRRLARAYSSNSADVMRSSTGSFGSSQMPRRSLVRFRLGDIFGSGRVGWSTSRRMLAKRHDGSDVLADDPANGIVFEIHPRPAPNPRTVAQETGLKSGST